MTNHRSPLGRPVVNILTSHLVPTLGLERAIYDWVELVKDRYDVEITCVGGTAPEVKYASAVQTLGSPLRKLRRMLAPIRLRQWASELPAETTVVVVGAWTAIPWLIVAGHRSQQTIVWEHSLSTEKLRHSRGLRILSWAARHLYPRCPTVVCVSEALAGDVRSMMPGCNVVTIPNCPRIPSMSVLLGRLEHRCIIPGKILAVGSLSTTKNLTLLISAMTHLPDHYRLSVAGDGPERESLSKMCADLNLTHRVDFLGHIDHDALEQEYSTAAVMAHPAHGETFGYVFYEAAGWGVPVVALNYGVSRHLIPDLMSGALVRSDARAMGAAIYNLAEHPPSNERVVESGRALRRQLDPASVLDDWDHAVSAINPAQSASRRPSTGIHRCRQKTCS